ncbi:ABC transporter ATP-binding protein [Haloquadratum walsbyi]|uniref:ABC-type multidrug transport system, ATPase and permease component n=1 Tax=Haloquadratum walsbyi J07HQW2 TaxID=1238425 RepID=U1PTD1_9EURY|nr:ABC transporter ATP-binding protein [Haloquadratum walsbyi]ERG97057.1 MAG: ABC-type multidrug transport system, ATPase and permease component [Haloquadratum walsbyi J07HQW2]
MSVRNLSERLGRNSVFWMYISHWTQYRKYILIAVISGAIGTALTQIPQIAFGLVIEVIDPSVTQSQFPFADSLLSSRAQDRTTQVSIVFFIAIFLIAVFRFISGYLWDVFKESFQKSIRVDCYESIQELHPRRFIQHSSGEYLSVIESDVKQVGDLPRTVLSGVSNDIVNIFTTGIVLFSLNWQFSILLLAPVPLIGWYAFRFNNVIEPLYQETRKSSASLTEQLSSSIRGILTVRSYVAEDREIERVQEVSENVQDTRLAVSKTWLSYAQVFGLTSRFSSFLVLSAGAFWVINGPPLFFTQPLTTGELAVFFTNATLLIQPATSLRSYVDEYKDAKASADRVYNIIQVQTEDEKQFDDEFNRINGEIQFEDASFSYSFDTTDPLTQLNEANDESDTDDNQDEPFAFGPVDCQIQPGETVGVVGRSGSGKTTFIRLLLRFIDVDTGTIRVDGKDISEYDPKSLREHIGYVEQQPYIFDSTLEDNIRYGNISATEEELERAIERAALHGPIDTMEDGLNTNLGESGSRMSGGEKQRVAIARAILSDPEVLVLDEATSHVDNITESKIQTAIEEATEERTTIIIAHRLSTIRNADRIFVLDNGNIVEQGTHKNLLEIDDGLYNELWSKHVGKAH